MTHKIELEDLQKWLQEGDITFASSARERKRLVCSLAGGLKITVGGKTVWQGMHPFDAVEAYNAITEKYVDELKDFRI